MPARRPSRTRHAYDQADDGGSGGARFAAALLALAVVALVVFQALWQLTAPAPAGRLLRAALPPLTDLDQTLAAEQESLRELARGQPPDGVVSVPGLPIPVQVTRAEVESDPALLREVVLRRMSEAVYRQGTAAFSAEGGQAPSPTILSSGWALRRAINFLTAARHDTLGPPRLAAILATLALAALTIWLFEGPARLSGPGVSIIAGGVLGGLVALVTRGFAIAFYGEDEVGDAIVRQVARGVSMTMLLVALTFLVFGVAVTVLGALARRWDQAPPAGVAAAASEPRPVERQRGEQ